jgi:hypothetical protein
VARHEVRTEGDISVVFDTRDQASVDAALKQLDPRLFLDPERDRSSGAVFWTVKCWVGSGQRPAHVLDWREPDGTPRPLSSGLVYTLEARKRNFGRDLVADGMAANDEARRRIWDETAEQVRDAGVEFERRRRLGSFAIVPRSKALAMTRARMRSEGKA